MPTITTAETLCGPRPAPHTMAFLRWCDEYISRRKRQCTFKRPTVLYFDAVNGNDSNATNSISTPWQTWGKAQAYLNANTGGNYSLLFRRGQTFRAGVGINLSVPNVHFGAYGPIPSSGVVRPIISHFSVRWPAGSSWSQSGSTNRWSATVPGGGTNNPSSTQVVGFVRAAIDPLNPLRCQPDATACLADDYSFAIQGGTVHINLGGINPNTIDIEAVPVASQTWPTPISITDGIAILNGSDNVWIDGLRFDGWGAGSQGVTASGSSTGSNVSGVRNMAQGEHVAYISNCESYYNGAHAFSQEPNGIGGTHIVEDCLAGYGFNAPNGDGVFNTYAGDAQQECVFRRCFVRFGSLPQNLGTGGRFVEKGSITLGAPLDSLAFYGHAAPNTTQSIGLYLNIDCGILDERDKFERGTALRESWQFPETLESGTLFNGTSTTNPSSIRAFVIGWKSPRSIGSVSANPIGSVERMIFINTYHYVRRNWSAGNPKICFLNMNTIFINPIFEIENEGGDRTTLFHISSGSAVAGPRLINPLIIVRGHTTNDAESRFHLVDANSPDKFRMANFIVISDRWRDGSTIGNGSGIETWSYRNTFTNPGVNSTNCFRFGAVAGVGLANSGSYEGFSATTGLINLSTPNNSFPDAGIFSAEESEARRLSSGGLYTLDPASPLVAAGSANPFSDKSDMLPAPEYDFFGRRRPATPSIGPVDVINLSSGGGGGGGGGSSVGMVRNPVRSVTG
jgi:hypothetical protein